MLQGLRSTADACTRAAGIVAALLCACATNPPPRLDTENALATIAGARGAIDFRSAAPIDADRVDGSLSLATALRLAVERDPELRSALARTRAALAEAGQARLHENPLLSIALRLPLEGGPAEIDAGLVAPLASLLTRPDRIGAADARVRAAAAASIERCVALVAELRERYARARALDDRVPLLDARRSLVRRLEAIATARFDAGEAPRLDVVTLQARRVELEVAIAELDAEREDARIALARLVGTPSAATAWTLDPWPLSTPAIPGEASWIAAALDKRPDLAAARWEIAARKHEAHAAGVAIQSDLAAGLSAERGSDWAIGPSLATPLPIFDDGSQRRARATAALEDARHALVARTRTAIEEVRRTRIALVRSDEVLARVRDELLPLLERRRAQVEDVYLAGQADIAPVLLAEDDLQDAQARLVELHERRATSLARLERAVGGPVASALVLAEARSDREQP